MSLVSEAVAAMKDFVLLSAKVDQLGALVDELSSEIREQDRRLVRLETMVEMAQRGPRLESDQH